MKIMSRVNRAPDRINSNYGDSHITVTVHPIDERLDGRDEPWDEIGAARWIAN